MSDSTFRVEIRSTGLIICEALKLHEVEAVLQLLENPSSVTVIPHLPEQVQSEVAVMSPSCETDSQICSVFDRSSGRLLVEGLTCSELEYWMAWKDPSRYRVERTTVSKLGDAPAAASEVNQLCCPVFDRDSDGEPGYETASSEDNSGDEPIPVAEYDEPEEPRSNALRWVVAIVVAIIGLKLSFTLFEEVLFPLITKFIWVAVPGALVVFAFIWTVKWVDKG